MVRNTLIEKCFLKGTTLKNTTIKTDLSFTLVHKHFGPPKNSSTITHFRLSETLTPLCEAHYEKRCIRSSSGMDLKNK